MTTNDLWQHHAAVEAKGSPPDLEAFARGRDLEDAVWAHAAATARWSLNSGPRLEMWVCEPLRLAIVRQPTWAGGGLGVCRLQGSRAPMMRVLTSEGPLADLQRVLATVRPLEDVIAWEADIAAAASLVHPDLLDPTSDDDLIDELID